MGIGFGIGAITFSFIRYKIQNKPMLAANEDIQNNTDPNISHPERPCKEKRE